MLSFKLLLPFFFLAITLTTLVSAAPFRHLHIARGRRSHTLDSFPSSPHFHHHHTARKRASTLTTTTSSTSYTYPRRSAIPHSTSSNIPTPQVLELLKERVQHLKEIDVERRRWREVKRALGRVRTGGQVEGVRRWVEEEIYKAGLERRW